MIAQKSWSAQPYAGFMQDGTAAGRHTERMKPRITLLTIGVDDLDRAFAFYANGLGLPGKGIVGKEFEHGAVAFFDLQNGLKLALFPRDNLAHDVGIQKTAPTRRNFPSPTTCEAWRRSTP
jgi:predicted enzyme related to lactoylglutathione lyase